jgi:transposase-like protein
VTVVLTLLSHGCPLQAIVAAFGIDERTVTAWLLRAGQHCQQVHEYAVSDTPSVSAKSRSRSSSWG